MSRPIRLMFMGIPSCDAEVELDYRQADGVEIGDDRRAELLLGHQPSSAAWTGGDTAMWLMWRRDRNDS
jgi:hypothetical protein